MFRLFLRQGILSLAVLVVAFPLAFSSGRLQAAPIMRALTIEITQTNTGSAIDLAPDIQVGDRFTLQFTYDDSVMDAGNFFFFSGAFPNALTALSLTRDPSNTGSWNPNTGTFMLPGMLLTDGPTGSFGFGGDPNANFPNIQTESFSELALLLMGGTINDIGIGQTLNEQLGGPLNAATFPTRSGTLSFNGDRGIANFNILVAPSSTVVPEPSGLALVGLAIATVFGWARRNRRRANGT